MNDSHVIKVKVYNENLSKKKSKGRQVSFEPNSLLPFLQNKKNIKRAAVLLLQL